MKLYRLVFLFFCFVLLSGCSKEQPVPTPSPSATTAQATPQPQQIVVSMVWLNGPTPAIAEEELKAKLAKVWDDGDFTLTYAGATSYLKRGEWFLQIYQYQEPYFDKGAFDFEQIEDLRLREALKNHTGWIAVDAITWPKDIEPEESYKTVGKILAELAEGQDCLALYLPAITQFLPYDEELLVDLRSDPLGAFEKVYDPPVVAAESGDPELEEATREARATWP